MVCEHSRSETEEPSGTISSRSRRTSCHPRPYISDLSSCVPPRDPCTLQRLYHPPSSSPSQPPSRSARYTGSCDPRRGKLSTLTPRRRERGERERVALRAIYVDYSTDKRLPPLHFDPVSRSCFRFPPSFVPSSFSCDLPLDGFVRACPKGKRIMTITRSRCPVSGHEARLRFSGGYSDEEIVKSFARREATRVAIRPGGGKARKRMLIARWKASVICGKRPVLLVPHRRVSAL